MPEVLLKCPICNGQHSVLLTEAQARSESSFVFACPDLARRYRLTSFYVDTRRQIHDTPHLLDIAESQRNQLKSELGELEFEMKFERWKKIDYPAIGLPDEYTSKISQIVNTYSIGYSYPAVTAACCLAERVLNRLVLCCRDHFKSHSEYKRIYRKDSFDDWEKMLALIVDWRLIPDKAVGLFRDLMPIRHNSIHFNDPYDFNDIAPIVINKLISGITEVFGVENRTDIYLVFDIPGEIWVRSAAESLPFVKEFVIPHCYYAHAVHEIDLTNRRLIERLGRIGPLTDDEFVALRKESQMQTTNV
jgi:hypothetical protein